MTLDRKLLTGGSLIIAAVILFAVNVFTNATFTSTRLDLTEAKLFTLTDGTINVLKKLNEPITLRLFLSKKEATSLPGISGYAQRVQDLLAEYERIAGGALRLQVIDPEPFSEQEDRAVAYGLRGVGLNGDAVLYFGLVGTNSTDDQEIVPFFSPSREQFLEHDLTKLIYQLANPKQKVIGLLSTLPMDGGMPIPGQGMGAPWVVVEQLRQLFEIRTIATDADAIPDDVNVLMIVHPKNLPPITQYAIDQFILAGGRALIFVDPNSESDQPGSAAMLGGAPGASDLTALFEKWGVQLIDGKVAGDLQLAEQVRFSDNNRAAVAEFPVWVNLQPDQFNKDDVITAQLGNLLFATPGILESQGDDGIRFTPLVETTPSAMRIDVAKLRFLTDPTSLLREYRPGGEKLVLAARISGKVKTAFPDGRPKVEEDKDDQDDQQPAPASESKPGEDVLHLSEAKDAINVIVVADTDLLNDRFWVRAQNFLGSRIFIPTAANGAFVTNAVESLLGSNDLISVRSRGRFQRPFTKVAEIQQQAELRFRQKEQELLTSLREAETKLVALEERKQGGDTLILSAEQQQEIEKFRQEKIRIRKDLRAVRHQLSKNIERLEAWTKFVNIGLMPILIGAGGIIVSLQRGRRRRKIKAGNQRHD